MHERVPVPLVIHGGTGFPPDAIAPAIAAGVAKFNVGTVLRSAFLRRPHRSAGASCPPSRTCTRRSAPTAPADVLEAGKAALVETVRDLIRQYGAVAEQPDEETLAGLYRQMLLIRRFEETVYYLFLEGEIPGTLHQYQGQEAVAVGICDALRPTDWITSTHRPHGHALAKGRDPARRDGRALRQGHRLLRRQGRLDAPRRPGGRDAARDSRSSARGNTVVTGIGLAFALRRTDQVAVCFFGDGASNEGAFHEGMNFAAVRRLPIVFVCENNLYGASTPFDAVSALVDVADRAAAYGIPGRVVDGMDVLAVREAGAEAVASARAGDGPTLLECKTYRFVGHSRSDARGYRASDEEAAWKERDPIPRLRAVLVEPARSASKRSRLEREVEATIEDAVEFARASPDADPQEALTDVYA